MRTRFSNPQACGFRSSQITRATECLSGVRRALALATVLLLPAAALAQAAGGGAAGAGATGGSSAGAPSGAERPPTPTAPPAQEPAEHPTEAPPPAAQPAVEEGPTGMPDNWWENWTDTKKQIRDDIGLDFALYTEYTARYETNGPDAGVFRNIFRYDLALDEHFTKDSLLSMQVRGGWGEGLDPLIGTFANTDQYANAGADIFILHLYYQQKFFDEQLILQIGKYDIGDWLDTNRYGYYNFLGYVMAHNTTIPLVGNTLGAMATWAPKDAGWYVAGGASNAAQTPTEAGFNTLDESQWLSMLEIGIKPKIGGREGVYRFIGWETGKEFTNTVGQTFNTSYGGAISFDQDITDQWGLFARYGVTESNPFEPKMYYQAGFLVKEPIAGRKKDTLAFGFVVNQFSDNFQDTTPDSKSTEDYFELYYNLQLFPWLQIQPVAQAIINPGGTDRDTSLIFGVHLHTAF